MGDGLKRAFTATKLSRLKDGCDKHGPVAPRLGYACPECDAKPSVWCTTTHGNLAPNLHKARIVPKWARRVCDCHGDALEHIRAHWDEKDFKLRRHDDPHLVRMQMQSIAASRGEPFTVTFDDVATYIKTMARA